MNFQLNQQGTYANKIGTGEWHNTETSTEYLEWVSEGNKPLPPDPEPTPEPLTPQQKLEVAGLTVEELKELLGL